MLFAPPNFNHHFNIFERTLGTPIQSVSWHFKSSLQYVSLQYVLVDELCHVTRLSPRQPRPSGHSAFTHFAASFHPSVVTSDLGHEVNVNSLRGWEKRMASPDSGQRTSFWHHSTTFLSLHSYNNILRLLLCILPLQKQFSILQSSCLKQEGTIKVLFCKNMKALTYYLYFVWITPRTKLYFYKS